MIEISRLLLDFGLCILIWMVQLIVYPSFLFFSDNNLFTWHKTYTKAIALIVMPLMLGQLSIVIYQVFLIQNAYTLTSIVLVFFYGHYFIKICTLASANFRRKYPFASPKKIGPNELDENHCLDHLICNECCFSYFKESLKNALQ